jgi:hypothetical protein
MRRWRWRWGIWGIWRSAAFGNQETIAKAGALEALQKLLEQSEEQREVSWRAREKAEEALHQLVGETGRQPREALVVADNQQPNRTAFRNAIGISVILLYYSITICGDTIQRQQLCVTTSLLGGLDPRAATQLQAQEGRSSPPMIPSCPLSERRP